MVRAFSGGDVHVTLSTSTSAVVCPLLRCKLNLQKLAKSFRQLNDIELIFGRDLCESLEPPISRADRMWTGTDYRRHDRVTAGFENGWITEEPARVTRRVFSVPVERSPETHREL